MKSCNEFAEFSFKFFMSSFQLTCVCMCMRVLWQLFTFADTYRGKYDSSIPLAKKYYQSASGYDVSQPFLIKRSLQDSRHTVLCSVV